MILLAEIYYHFDFVGVDFDLFDVELEE